MRLRFIRVLVAGLMCLTIGWSLFSGCKEKDIPFVIDADEIVRYILESPEAKELFRVSGQINSEPYTVPFDNGVYLDSLLGVTRGFEVSLVPLKRLNPETGDSVRTSDDTLYADYGFLGMLREGLVRVVDDFRVQTTREYNDSTLVDTATRRLTRYGFFLKLGSDAQPYVGWSLWGFNGIGDVAPPVSVSIEKFDATTFSGDFSIYRHFPRSKWAGIPRVPYMRLSEMDTVVDGSRLVVTTNQASSAPTTVYHLLSALGRDGAFTRAMVRMDTINVDTVRTMRNNPNLYNLLVLQAFANNRFSYVMSWCVPYRI